VISVTHSGPGVCDTAFRSFSEMYRRERLERTSR
jgi:hypothetical protein